MIHQILNDLIKGLKLLDQEQAFFLVKELLNKYFNLDYLTGDEYIEYLNAVNDIYKKNLQK